MLLHAFMYNVHQSIKTKSRIINQTTQRSTLNIEFYEKPANKTLNLRIPLLLVLNYQFRLRANEFGQHVKSMRKTFFFNKTMNYFGAPKKETPDTVCPNLVMLTFRMYLFLNFHQIKMRHQNIHTYIYLIPNGKWKGEKKNK